MGQQNLEEKIIEWYEKNKIKLQALMNRYKQSKPQDELLQLIEAIDKLSSLPSTSLRSYVGDIVQLKKLIDSISKNHSNSKSSTGTASSSSSTKVLAAPEVQIPVVSPEIENFKTCVNGLHTCFNALHNHLTKKTRLNDIEISENISNTLTLFNNVKKEKIQEDYILNCVYIHLQCLTQSSSKRKGIEEEDLLVLYIIIKNWRESLPLSEQVTLHGSSSGITGATLESRLPLHKRLRSNITLPYNIQDLNRLSGYASLK